MIISYALQARFEEADTGIGGKDLSSMIRTLQGKAGSGMSAAGHARRRKLPGKVSALTV
jgi:hypothetical protein